MIKKIAKLFGVKSKYSNYKIELHRKYNGTYMLFGFHARLKKFLLLGESSLPQDATKWATKYNCETPRYYSDCNICCPWKLAEVRA